MYRTFLDERSMHLATILCLPLVDGAFAKMLVSVSIRTLTDILAFSVTIFAGAGALAVLTLSASLLYSLKMPFTELKLLDRRSSRFKP